MRWSSIVLASLQSVYMFLTCRSSPFLIDYYIPDEYYTLPVLICSGISHICLSILTAVIVSTAAMFALTLAVHIKHIIADDIRCGLKGSYRTLETLRTGYHMRITYTSLVILHDMNMEVSGVLLYPMNWLMMKMVIFCGANLIKYHKLMKPLVRYLVGGWALSGLLLWGIALEVGGYMFLCCERSITSWKYHNWGHERKIMSKFKKSCRPIKVSYHKVFSIKRISVLKFFRSVAKSFFKAFVAL